MRSSAILPYHQQQSDIADGATGLGPAVQQPSPLELKDLHNHIHTTKWYELGLQLIDKDSVHELNIILRDHKGDTKIALQETLNLVYREDPDLSWLKVVKALMTVGEARQAKIIKDKFCKTLNFI